MGDCSYNNLYVCQIGRYFPECAGEENKKKA